MTQPAAVPPPVESSNADEVIVALGALLIAGTTVAAVKTLLGGLKGVAAATMRTIFTQRKLGGLIGKKAATSGTSPAARLREIGAQEQAKARAAYIVRCIQRLAPAYATKDPAVIAAARKREDSYLAAQGRAAADRQTALNGLIKAVGKRKPDGDGRLLLGWYLDDAANNCAACIAADGTNFDALDPPAIGWPGWVHAHCYCEAGAPHDTEVMVNDVVTQRAEMPDEIRTLELELEPEARASGLQATKNGRKLWKWLTGAGGLSKFAKSPHPWQALVDFLISKGVNPETAKGEATNIMQATAVGKALFAKGHKGKHKGRSTGMNTETRAAVITEVRGPGTAKPDDPPGFTARMVPYGVPDSYRTSWKQGVFGPALEKRAAAGHATPVVWNHDPGDPVGQIVNYRDEPDAFYTDVEFDDLEAVPRAKQAHAQLRANAKTGKPTMGQFSFAFVRGEEEEDPQHRGVMLQTEVREIHEFSIVLNGAVPGTGVTSVRSASPAGTVDARTAADLFAKVAAGSMDLTDALLELRSASAPAAPAAQFEIRAIDGTNPTIEPLDVLAQVDTALVAAAEELDKGEVEAARKFFSTAASRLSEFQYLLAMVPGVEGYGESYAWRELQAGEQRSEEPPVVEQDDENPFTSNRLSRRLRVPANELGYRGRSGWTRR